MPSILQSDAFRIGIALLGFICFIVLILFLLWKYELIWNYNALIPSNNQNIVIESAIGTQPILNATAYLDALSCGKDKCQGLNFQAEWAWCNKCGSIFNVAGLYKNCYAGGLHNRSGSGKYKINTSYVPTCNSQSGWRMCIRCSCLINSASSGVCYDKQTHRLSNSLRYYVCTKRVHSQCGWKLCQKCGSLFYSPSSSRCWDGETHMPFGNIDYQLNTYIELPDWMSYPFVFDSVICNDLDSPANLNLVECQQKCRGIKKCNAINYTPSKKECRLKQCPQGQLPYLFYKGSQGYSTY